MKYVLLAPIENRLWITPDNAGTLLDFADERSIRGSKKEDAGRQTLEHLHQRRKQVVRLHKRGIKIMQIVALTGLSYPPVRAAIDLSEVGD